MKKKKASETGKGAGASDDEVGTKRKCPECKSLGEIPPSELSHRRHRPCSKWAGLKEMQKKSQLELLCFRRKATRFWVAVFSCGNGRDRQEIESGPVEAYERERYVGITNSKYTGYVRLN